MIRRALPIHRFSLAGLLLLSTACSTQDKQTPEMYKTRTKGVDIEVSAHVKRAGGASKADISLQNVFDGNPATGCLFQVEYGSDIRLTFSKPVYLQGVMITAGPPNLKEALASTRLAKHIVVEAFPGDEEIFPGDSRRYQLQDTNKPQRVPLDGGFLKLLRVTTLVIEVDNEAEDGSHPALWLSEIEPRFSDKPTFRPTMTLAEIKEQYARGDQPWSFDAGKAVSEGAQEKVLMNLVYFALNGSREAEKMLRNYSPAGADSGEWASFIQSWYDSEKSSR